MSWTPKYCVLLFATDVKFYLMQLYLSVPHTSLLPLCFVKENHHCADSRGRVLQFIPLYIRKVIGPKYLKWQLVNPWTIKSHDNKITEYRKSLKSGTRSCNKIQYVRKVQMIHGTILNGITPSVYKYHLMDTRRQKILQLMNVS